MTLVSVIVPTYNRADLVGQAINSLLAQTRLPDEIIVIDDGSSDDTSTVLARYGPPVQVIRQHNRGRSAARNTGLGAASGDLIAFLDSDDWLPPESITRRAIYLEQNPAVGLVYSDAYLNQEQGELFSQRYPVAHPSGMVFAELAQHCFFGVSSVMARRSCLGSDRFDETLEQGEDFDLWLRLATRCPFAYLPEPLAVYRMPAGAADPRRWGFPGSTYTAQALQAQQNELLVQQRAFAMPAFAQLSRRQRARIAASHAVKQVLIGSPSAARSTLLKAIRTAPTDPLSYGLLAFCLIGRLEWLILQRRRLSRIVHRGK